MSVSQGEILIGELLDDLCGFGQLVWIEATGIQAWKRIEKCQACESCYHLHQKC